MAEPLPLLWLCGPPGSGKTASGWEIFSRLSAAGVEVGYVDVDQLGICYPEPPTDRGRHQMKAANVAKVVSTFSSAGARGAIVSGVPDPGRGVDTSQLADFTVTVWRLRASHADLEQRLRGRGRGPKR